MVQVFTILSKEESLYQTGILSITSFIRHNPYRYLFVFSENAGVDILQGISPYVKVFIVPERPYKEDHVFSREVMEVLPPGESLYIESTYIHLRGLPKEYEQFSGILAIPDPLLNLHRALFKETNPSYSSIDNPLARITPSLGTSVIGINTSSIDEFLLKELKNVPLNYKNFNEILARYPNSTLTIYDNFFWRKVLEVSTPSVFWEAILQAGMRNNPSGAISFFPVYPYETFKVGNAIQEGATRAFCSTQYTPEEDFSTHNLQVVVISRNQGHAVEQMVLALIRQLPGVPILFVLDRCSDNSAQLLKELKIPFVIRDGDPCPFRAGSSRNVGANHCSSERHILFLDGDRIPSGLTIDLLNKGMTLWDVLCLSFVSGSEHRYYGSFGPGFSPNTLVAPYLFHQGITNKVFSNGLLVHRNILKAVKALQGGQVFLELFDGKHGDEDIMFGTISSMLGALIGFFPFGAGTLGPLTQCSRDPTLPPANREITKGLHKRIESINPQYMLTDSNLPLRNRLLQDLLRVPQVSTPIDRISRGDLLDKFQKRGKI